MRTDHEISRFSYCVVRGRSRDISFFVWYRELIFLNRLNTDGDKTNNITEIFADNLSDISNDDENMDICEDDYDFEDINEVMIPVKKRKRVLEKKVVSFVVFHFT